MSGVTEGKAFHSCTSLIKSMPDKGIVYKHVGHYLDLGVLSREAQWLLKAARYPESRAPRLYQVSGQMLTLEYKGEPVMKDTLPRDWKDQAEDILNFLKLMECCHNDIKPTDIVVNDKGLMSLLDYQWATPTGVEPDKDWPDGLGGAYKHPTGWDDGYSLYKSLEDVARGR